MKYCFIFILKSLLFIMRSLTLFSQVISNNIKKILNIELDEETESDGNKTTPNLPSVYGFMVNKPKISVPNCLADLTKESNVELKFFSSLISDKSKRRMNILYAVFAVVFNVITRHRLSMKDIVGKKRNLSI